MAEFKFELVGVYATSAYVRISMTAATKQYMSCST